ncbi:hypothetical protein [Chryseobacterium sp. ON_d1]|uniref:hypothetical protein n=1 Tax=Chryseobacterium sp. ON_d1 TaxID=2583211 RepID=UPI00115A4AE5|nr:hypothetical protein [Chryseobacterium sp. ON_d1]GEJ45999.1 hypothetical protein CRS_26070 [Chryseobacterium sp. ON_d1]
MKQVFKLELNGSWFIDEDYDNILETLKSELEELELNEIIDVRISLIEMSESEYNNLPEFDGF